MSFFVYVFFFSRKNTRNGSIGPACFARAMQEEVPLKRTSVGTVRFGAAAAKLDLLQQVECPYTGDVTPAVAKVSVFVLLY
jgi:hypothetical protein